jgi:hypothetical protein
VEYLVFLDKVISDGIAAARADYAQDEDKREGSVAGFEACRNKSPAEILAILEQAGAATRRAHLAQDPHYWKVRCFEAEVEWVANVVSAVLVNEGKKPLAAHLPTARAVMKAARIVGVRAPS